MYLRVNDGTNGFEIWKSDGTTEGTVLAQDIAPGKSSAFPSSMTLSGNNIFLVADENGSSSQLYVASANVILPVILSSVKAYQQGNDIAVKWKVENETGIKDYFVQKSINGTSFTSGVIIPSKGNNTGTVNYGWLWHLH